MLFSLMNSQVKDSANPSLKRKCHFDIFLIIAWLHWKLSKWQLSVDAASDKNESKWHSSCNILATSFQEDAQKQTEVLSQAKDRAQLTATGAMSVIQVALLRQVIDSGNEMNRYYTASIALIITALFLQIISGMISIFVSNMSSYFGQYGGNIMKDCCANLCCCTIIKKEKRTRKRRFGLGYIEETKSLASLDDVLDSKRPRLCPCCPKDGCELRTDVVDNKEIEAIQAYDQWAKQQMKLSLKNEAAMIEYDNMTKVIQKARARLDRIKTGGATQEWTEVQNVIHEATQKRDDLEKMMLNKKISDALGALLKKKVESIRKMRIYKTATFWQQVLNYIFFLVFVMQAFIAGMTIGNDIHHGGLAGHPWLVRTPLLLTWFIFNPSMDKL